MNIEEIISLSTRFDGYYLTQRQVADIYAVDLETVQQWIDNKWIESVCFDNCHHIEIGQIEHFSISQIK